MDDLIREMITPPRRSSLDSSRRTRLVATTLTVGLAFVGVTSLTTGALFTDQKTLSSSDFTTGTVVIDPTKAAVTSIGAGNMAPGDTAYDEVLVTNAGTLSQRYAISIQASNAQAALLTNELKLALYALPTGSCTAAGVVGQTPIGLRDTLPTALTPLVGDKAPGQDADIVPATAGDTTPGVNDIDRTLIAGASETLCVAVSLPITTGNAFQNTTASFELTFDAEQTANND